jgi:hypothetical protein
VDAGDRMQVSRRILDVAHKLDQLRTGEAEPDLARAEPSDADVVPIESLQYDTIESDQADAIPIASLAPDAASADPAASALETSFRTLERLQRERGSSPPSLEALLGRAEPVAEPVAIEVLCYRGRAALERAATVRQTLASELAATPDLAAIRPLLQELLDLVPLALDES